MKRFALISTVLLVSALLVAGCGGAPAGEEAASGEVILKMTGAVGTEVGWTEAELRAMDTVQAETTNKAGETESHTGVALSTLLGAADLSDDALALVFVGSDGYTAEVTLDELGECADCMVAFGDEGTFDIVLPGFSGKLNVKDVVELQVK